MTDQYEQQSSSSSQSQSNNSKSSAQQMQLLIRFQQQESSQLMLKENIQNIQQKLLFQTDDQNKDLLMIRKIVISLKSLYQSSWTKLQKKKFLQKLQYPSYSYFYSSSQSCQILSKIVKLQGLKFVKEYRISTFNLFKYNRNAENMQYDDESIQQEKIKFTKLPEQLIAIYLPRLLYLQLQYSHISNIESLSFINAPSLMRISLNANHIVNLSSFQKCHFPQLQFVAMEHNPISNIQNFYRGNFNNLLIYPKDYLKEQFGSLVVCYTFSFQRILVEIIRYLYVNNFNLRSSPYLKRILKFKYSQDIQQ